MVAGSNPIVFLVLVAIFLTGLAITARKLKEVKMEQNTPKIGVKTKAMRLVSIVRNVMSDFLTVLIAMGASWAVGAVSPTLLAAGNARGLYCLSQPAFGSRAHISS